MISIKQFNAILLKVTLFAWVMILSACFEKSTAVIEPVSSSSSAAVTSVDYSLGHAMNQRLGRGMNLGNALDAECYRNCIPDYLSTCTEAYTPAKWDGCWSNPIDSTYFQVLKAAGFQSIRLPVRWSEKASNTAPFTIDPRFTARVRELIHQSIAAGLPVVLNVHHYNDLYDNLRIGDQIIYTDYALQKVKFVELWRQISIEFQNEPNEWLVFELLNEPRARVTKADLNTLIAEVWPIIRATNPGRTIMVNPVNWGNYRNIPDLILPPDGNVIASGHIYEPHEFTHQGTDNTGQYPIGPTWGSLSDQNALLVTFQSGLDRIKQKFPGTDGGTIPLNIGEFGATRNADLESRVAYSLAVRREAERLNMSWHYWGFVGVGFDSWSRTTGQWTPEILQALIP